jgi:hypothetical protein
MFCFFSIILLENILFVLIINDPEYREHLFKQP